MKKTQGRKLMTAAVGVATVSYVISCGRTSLDSGRDNEPIATDAIGTAPNPMPPNSGIVSGNLLPPPDPWGPTGPTGPVPPGTGLIAGNLVAPPPWEDSTTGTASSGPVGTETATSDAATDGTPTDSPAPTSESTGADSLDSTSGLIAGNLLPPPATSAEESTSASTHAIDAGPAPDAAVTSGETP